MNPKFIDSHTHVQFVAYKDDADEVIKRALEDGVWLVNVGTQYSTSQDAITLAEKYTEGVYATVGLHPIHTDESFHDAQEIGGDATQKGFTSRGEDFDYEKYKKLASHPKVVAIGECGLDYYRLNHADVKPKQEVVFISQINLALEIKKPLMIHCRSAFSDLISILKNNSSKLQNPPGLIHFFSGTHREANQLLDMGFYFSFGGVVTFTRDYDEIIKSVPLNRLLLETDAPYVSPEPHRGQRNEPLYVTKIAPKLAEIKDVDLDEIAHHTTENSRSVLRI